MGKNDEMSDMDGGTWHYVPVDTIYICLGGHSTVLFQTKFPLEGFQSSALASGKSKVRCCCARSFRCDTAS